MTQDKALAATSAQILNLRALGCNLRLTFGGRRADEAVTAVREAWDWCLDETPDVARESLHIHVTLDDGVREVQNSKTEIATSDVRFLMHVLSQAVTVACIDQMAGSLLMLHAGAIADRGTGRALGFVARSGTGKTTLTAALGEGRMYLTDETVALREDHTLLPYPKPLSVRSDEGFKLQIRPEEFGLLKPHRRTVLAALWFLERSAVPIQPSLTPVSTLDALVMLAPQVSYLAALSTPLARLAAAVESVGGLQRVVYHDAADLRPHADLALRGHP